MEPDLRQLIALIKRQLPEIYPNVCDDNVIEYLEHDEGQLAVELLTYNAEPSIDQLPTDVLGAIAQIILTYDMYEFADDPNISARYDKFLSAADVRRIA